MATTNVAARNATLVGGIAVAIGAVVLAVKTSPPPPAPAPERAMTVAAPSPAEQANASQPAAQRQGSRADRYRRWDGGVGAAIVDRAGRPWTPSYNQALGMTVYANARGDAVSFSPWAPVDPASFPIPADAAPPIPSDDAGNPAP
jgi:hypothetical protein